jgi:hypothetical protein
LRMLFNTVGRFRKKAHRPWQWIIVKV